MAEEDGNGAREKLKEYFEEIIDGPLAGELKVDHLLAWLWERGYQVVPIPPTEGDEEDAQPDAAEAKQGAKIYPFGLFKKKSDGE